MQAKCLHLIIMQLLWSKWANFTVHKMYLRDLGIQLK